MKGINETLNETVKRECLIKSCVAKARKQAADDRPINRRRIEDILGAKELEESLTLSF